MKRSTMKNFLIRALAFAGIILLLQSCYDEPTSFLDQHATKGKGYYPVLSNVSGYESQYKQGDVATFYMEYFSQGDIDTITLDQLIATPDGDTTRSRVFSKGPDAGAFVDSLDLNTVNVSYTVPQVPDSTKITLKSKITNKNTLADSVSFTFTVLSK